MIRLLLKQVFSLGVGWLVSRFTAKPISQTIERNSSFMAFDLNTVLGIVAAIGKELVDLDTNKEGADDFAGTLIVYGADVIKAVEDGEDLPAFPEILKAGTTQKITGVLAATLKIANGALTFATYALSGKASKVLRYITQAISLLLNGEAVPAPPSSLLKA